MLRLFILNTSEHSCTVFLLRNLWLFVGKQKLTIHFKKKYFKSREPSTICCCWHVRVLLLCYWPLQLTPRPPLLQDCRGEATGQGLHLVQQNHRHLLYNAHSITSFLKYIKFSTFPFISYFCVPPGITISIFSVIAQGAL